MKKIFLSIFMTMIMTAFVFAKTITVPIVSLERTVYLEGPITMRLVGDIVRHIRYLDKINQSDIRMYICTPGGSVVAGLRIIDAMDSCKSNIQTIGDGYVGSMGVFILAHGTKGKRLICKNTKVYIHDVGVGLLGGYNQKELEKILKELFLYKENLIEIFSKDINKTIEETTKLLEIEKLYTAKQVVKLDIVDDFYEGE